MTWANKNKIPASREKGRLLTPDSNQILVGSNTDKVLIYQEAIDNYSYKSKTDDTGNWTNKTKTSA